MDTIKEMILDDMVEILMKKYENEEEMFFLEKFQTTSKLLKKEIDNSDVLLAFLRSQNQRESFETTKKKIKEIKNELNEFSSNFKSFESLIKVLYFLSIENIMDEFIQSEQINEKLIDNMYNKLSSNAQQCISKETFKVAIIGGGLFSIGYFETVQKRNIFLNIFKENINNSSFSDFLNYLSYKNYQNHEKGNINQTVDKMPRQFKRYIKRRTSKNNNKLDISVIKERYNKLKREYEKYDKKNKKAVLAYDKFLKELSQIDENKIIYISSDIEKLIENEKIKYEFNLYVLKNNVKFYKEIFNQNKNNKYTKINDLDTLLYNNDIKLNILSIDEKEKIINNKSIDEIKSIINEINYSNLNDLFKSKKQLFNILMYSDINKINIISNYIKKGILNLDFVLKNDEILLNNNDKFEIIIKNIELLLVNKSNIIKISEQEPNLLFCDYEELYNKIKLIKSYNINIQKKELNCNIYTDDMLIDLIDLFIEEGIYSQLKNNIELLNKNSFNIIKRLKIAKYINMNVFDNKKIINSILTGKNFYITDDDLDSYIDDYSNEYSLENYFDILKTSKRNKIFSDHYLIKELDNKYKISELEYNINGIIISRLKVLRNLKALYNNFGEINILMIYNAIIFKTNLNNEQYSILKQEVNSLNGKQKRL